MNDHGGPMAMLSHTGDVMWSRMCAGDQCYDRDDRYNPLQNYCMYSKTI